MRTRSYHDLEIGQVLRGEVTDICDFGLFIDAGGVVGLCLLTDLFWGRLSDLADLYEVGQSLTVMVLKVEPDQQRLILGVKQLTPDPWVDFLRTHSVGDRVFGEVIHVLSYSLLIGVTQDIIGTLMTPNWVANIGDQIEVQLLRLDKAKRELELSIISDESR